MEKIPFCGDTYFIRKLKVAINYYGTGQDTLYPVPPVLLSGKVFLNESGGAGFSQEAGDYISVISNKEYFIGRLFVVSIILSKTPLQLFRVGDF